MIKDFISFLISPTLQRGDFTILGKIWRTTILFFAMVLLQVIIQKFFLLFSHNKTSESIEYDDKLLGHVGLTYIIFVAPIIEELTFRLPLTSFNALYLRVSFSFIIASVVSKMAFYFLPPLSINIFHFEIGLAILIFLILSRVKFYQLEKKWDKQFICLYWISIILFSVLHLPYVIGLGFDFAEVLSIVISLILGAIFITYSRVRYGFFYALGIHMIYNFLTINV